jgi:hypothetical protein
MRILFGLALAGAFSLGHVADVRAQGAYYPAPPAAPVYRGYAFKDEPLMSINRSYLGYSNFVDYGPESALGSYSGYNAAVRARAAAPAPAYVPARTYAQTPTYYQAPTYAQPAPRRGFRLFGWRRGYGY